METSKAIGLGIYIPKGRDGGMSAGNVVTENPQYAVVCQINGSDFARLPFRRIHIVVRGRQLCQIRSFGLLTMGITCVDARYQGQMSDSPRRLARTDKTFGALDCYVAGMV